MTHSITVEPLTKALREAACLQRDPAHLAIVERTNGNLVKVCATTADYETAYATADGYARMYGATVLTASSYAPTVVGADIAEQVAARPDCQPATPPNFRGVTSLLDAYFANAPRRIDLYRAYSGPHAGWIRMDIGSAPEGFHAEARLVMGSEEIWERHQRGESPASIVAVAASRTGH